MAINLPEIGQVDWGGGLNSALTQLDEQTIVDARLDDGDLILVSNNGGENNVGNVQGPPGEDGAPGDDGAPGEQGPPGPPGSLFQTFIVEDYAEPGDVSDTDAWQRAVDESVALPPGTPSQIIGTKPEYEFHARVNIRGLKNCRIGGGAGARPTIKAAPGAGEIYAFGTSAGMGPVTPGGPDIVCMGDSLTADDNWLGQLSNYSGSTVVDLGLAGQTTTEIAFRSGNLPVTVTFSGNSIPTSGTATITTLTPADSWRIVGTQRQVRVAIKAPSGDVTGLFYWGVTSTPDFRFVADTPPASAISVPAGTAVEVLPDLPNKSAVGLTDGNLIYWAGRNNTSAPEVFERDDAAVMDAFSGQKMILGVLNTQSETRGTAGYDRVIEINKQKEATYGFLYWDVRKYIIHELIYAMNINPTEADLNNMALDAPPPSVMNDSTHPTPAASTVLGREMYRQAMYRGLVPYKTGDITENVVFDNIRFDGGGVNAPDGQFDRSQSRQFPADRIGRAISLDGHRTPGESAMGIVQNITVRDCNLHVLRSLPIMFRGCSNVTVEDCLIRRCLDTGFTWVYGVRFANNRVEWSADNGVSLSQGCEQVVCVGNQIVGSYYAGIHCGGWSGWPGAKHLTITGNTVINSRMFGISLFDGATHATVSANIVDGVLRGGASENRDYMTDGAGQFGGTGIFVSGYIVSSAGSSSPVIASYSRDVAITGNSVRNCDKNGINFAVGVSGITITGNTLRNIGSLTSVSGNPISSTHRYYNIAIGSYGLHSDRMSDVVVTGNQVIDDRPTPATNYAVSLQNVTRGNERSNAGFGTRNAQTF